MPENAGIEKAFILSGGLGTRLGELAEDKQKTLLPVKGKPILHHNINLMKLYGVKKVILGLGYKAESVVDYFKENDAGVELVYSIEKEPLGTAGALKFAAEYFDSTFIMMNGDELKDINLKEMAETHRKNKALGTIALVEVEDPSSYGVVRMDGEKIVEFVEKPKKEEAPSNLINSGTYILETKVIEIIGEGNQSIERNVFPKIAEMGRLYGYRHQGQWYPTDTVERYTVSGVSFEEHGRLI